jgi:vacuolar-type H+-ATPase subunit I/STV1
MVEAECHRCGREWDYTGRSNMYGTCPNCKTSVKLPRGSERAEPEAERCPDPSDRTTVEVAAGQAEPREVSLPEAVEAMDAAVDELYELGDARSETSAELAERVEEREESVEDLRRGLRELAGYFEDLIEEAGGEVDYENIEETGRVVPDALKNIDMEGFEA